MAWTKFGVCQCDYCGRFCRPYDEWTPFGCSNPEEPEPYDPSFVCEKCYSQLKDDWKRWLISGSGYGDWQKSKAEIEAAKELNMVWIGQDSIGDKRELFTSPSSKNCRSYCYVTQEEFERLMVLEEESKRRSGKR